MGFGKRGDDAGDTDEGRYKVDLIAQLSTGRVTDQMTATALQKQLNRRAAEGWTFVPPALDVNKSLLIVFERVTS